MEDGAHVNVFDLVVVLVGTGSDLNTSDKNESKSPSIEFALDGGGELVEVCIGLNIEAGVPLAVLEGEGDGRWSSLHICKCREVSIAGGSENLFVSRDGHCWIHGLKLKLKYGLC